jgi:hypothetical protein
MLKTYTTTPRATTPKALTAAGSTQNANAPVPKTTSRQRFRPWRQLAPVAAAFASSTLALVATPASLLAQDAAPLAGNRTARTVAAPAMSPAELTPITQQEYKQGFQQFRNHVFAVLRTDPTVGIVAVYHEQRVATGYYKLQARYRATFFPNAPQVGEQRATSTTPDAPQAAEPHAASSSNSASPASASAASPASADLADAFTIPTNPPPPPTDATLKPVPELPPTSWQSAK